MEGAKRRYEETEANERQANKGMECKKAGG